MEIRPSNTETTVTLTKAQASEFVTAGNVVTLAIMMSIIGVIGMIAIAYLLTRRDNNIGDMRQ